MAKRLVIVEDDTGTRTLLRMAAETAGWTVDYGSRQAEVWDAVLHADVVSLDLHLEGEDGLDILRRLRREGHTTPVVVLSGDDHPQCEVDAFEAGATRFVLKPFEVGSFLEVLEDVTEASDADQDVEIDLRVVSASTTEKPWFMS